MAYISFLLIVLTQAAPTPGATNRARQPYVIQLNDGSRLVGFWEEKQMQSGGKARVELDTPWTQWEMITLSNVQSAVAERASVTAERRKKAYENAGYVQLSNDLAVPKADYDFAQRARQMAGLDKPVGADPVGEEASAEEKVPAGTVASQAGEGPPLPGFFEQWGGHIGLVIVAVLLTGLVVRMTFLATD